MSKMETKTKPSSPAPATAAAAFALPTGPTPAAFEPGRLAWLIYGRAKSGKSTLAATWPGPLFFDTEGGLRCLSVARMACPDWPTLLRTAAAVRDGGHQYRTIVIDTVDAAYLACEAYVCRQAGITTPADLPYGQGHARVATEWRRVLGGLQALDLGLVLLSHEREQESQTPGQPSTIRPTLPRGIRDWLLGQVDVIARLVVDETGHRVLRTASTSQYDAGDRTGRLPDPCEATYAALSAALTETNGGTR